MKDFRLNLRTRFTAAFLALALIAGAAGLTLSIGPRPVSADSVVHGEVTFTKWVTPASPFPSFPWHMTGVVGGDVGTGTFVGEALSLDPIANGTIYKIHAHYHMYGVTHQFSADVYVTQNNQTNTAVINGVVTDGWRNGAQVHGGYAVLATCDIPTSDNAFGTLCFKGTLNIEPSS